MYCINSIPAVIRILIVFGIVLLAIRSKVSLGNAFIFGALFLGLLFCMPLQKIGLSMLLSLVHLKTMALAIIVSLILVLSHSMEAAGQMKRMLMRFEGLVQHPGLNLVTFPALIGLLPMPGGAIFSAPMVKNIGERQQVSGAKLSYINYWFRHIWEYWWPLYPGVLLTTTLAKIDLWTFVVGLFPLTLAAGVLGYWPLKSIHAEPNAGRRSGGDLRARVHPFYKELKPILIVILMGLGLGAALTPLLSPIGISIANEIGLIIALLVAIGWVWRHNRMSAKERRAILIRRELLRMVYMVAAILIFKGILQDSRAAEAVSAELMRWQIPLFSIAIILPMLVGAVCGITIAFVGTTYPILISLVQSLGQSHLMLPYMMLAMVSGFVGVLFSPLHLCLMLSNEYFQAPLTTVYRYLLPPCLGLIVAACLYFYILQSVL